MRKATGKAAHHIDILRHGSAHARTLHLNGNLFARSERCTMNLRQRCAAERMRIDRGEYLLPVDPIDRIERNEHRLERHGFAFLLKLRERLAIGMRQDLGTRREGLPNFDEARAKIFEERTQFFGGKPL